MCDLSEIRFGKTWGRDPVALSFPKAMLISPPEPHAGPGSPNKQDNCGLRPPPPRNLVCWPFWGERQDPAKPELGFWADTMMPGWMRGGGRAGAARPSRSRLLGHQPAFKELWLNEMFSCAKASLEMSQGNSREARVWPGWRARQCPEGCCSAQAGRGQMLCLPTPARPGASRPRPVPSHSDPPCLCRVSLLSFPPTSRRPRVTCRLFTPILIIPLGGLP